MNGDERSGDLSRDWPGENWCGYFSRQTVHRVNMANSERVARTLGLAECGAVAVRPQYGADFSALATCAICYPQQRTQEDG